MLKKLYDKNNNPRDMDAIVNALKDGELIIAPTDTMYALCCDALKERAIEKICKLKDLNLKKKSLSIICYDLSHISEFAKVDNATFKLMKRNLPGPFTFILPASSKLPKIFKNRKEVGIRIPDNAIMREICNYLGDPILTTTVPYNPSDDIEYHTNPELIDERLGGEVAYVIDGGIGDDQPSTIVDCMNGEHEIIRRGKGELEF